MALDPIRRCGLALLRGLALAGLGVATAVSFVVHLAFLVVGFGLGLLVLPPLAIRAGRPVTNLARRLAGTWSGVPVEVPYQPRPAPPAPDAEGHYPRDNRLYRRPWVPAALNWFDWLLGDPATYRDLAWLALNPVVGTLLGGAPAALVGVGLWYAASRAGTDWWALPAGLAAVAAGLALAPGLVLLHGRWTRLLLRPPRPEPGRLRVWYARLLVTLLRLLCLLGLSLLALPLAALGALGLLLGYGLGIVAVLPPLIENVRHLAELRRRLAGRWSGVEVPSPYLPRPELPPRRPDGRYRVGAHLYRTERWAGYHLRLRWLTRDGATWRDLVWLLLDPVVGGLMLAVPLAALGYGLFGLAVPRFWMLLGVTPEGDAAAWYAAVAGSGAAAIPVGLALAAFGVFAAPRVLRGNGRWVRLLLAPTARARLALRVRRLTETRADATAAQAAELRRIERDLHDGAQARLIAMGINLGHVEYLLDRDPAAARALLAETREASAKALAELRDLVRGIHPPVLAERGLADAIRALALDLPVRTEVGIELPGRAEPPIESAVYFAVSELLTNVVKHAQAERAAVELRYVDGRLRVVVRDDGRGGVDPARGSGVRGIERRLGTFDGVVEVSSPPGGPTVVTLEVPCALSSPRTSTS
ncbi:sensor histidine kinase [Micromonospora sp. HM5-17]|uniref:sensor histidine kinase n=1 Tax=Micromonospora sp. HM5-17 TaxID=2487710 RepID=UPI00131599ED|nr:sensor histidine kinase [Micromonospora sp. HM5-17]